jgi:outer membrane lipoprotein-sorting protein
VRALAGCVALLVATAALSAKVAPVNDITAAQIVEKNATARGGVDAWHKVQTMAWVGHVESVERPGRNMPFMLAQKRPNSTRFELTAENRRSVRIYDGTSGWKLYPGSAGLPELQPYTRDELNFARDAQAIDGPLMDDAAQGAAIALAGVDDIEGRRAYELKVTLLSGATHRVWVDTETFLETRYERDIRNAAGRSGIAAVVYRDYRTFEGLQLPTTIETGAATGAVANKLVIDKVALNPPLEDRMFGKPSVPTIRHNGVAVDTRSAPPAGAFRPPPKP